MSNSTTGGKLNTYVLNERFSWIVIGRYMRVLPLSAEQQRRMLKGRCIRYVDFATGNSVKTRSVRRALKFWMTVSIVGVVEIIKMRYGKSRLYGSKK
jgi:hypothetical protein